jgi:hypothetical protein
MQDDGNPGSSTGKTDTELHSAQAQWWKRGSTKVIAAVSAVLTAGAIAGVSTLAQQGAVSIGHVLAGSEVLSIHTASLSPGASCYGERGWTFPKRPAALPVPDLTNRSFSLDKWARQNGGIPASGYYVVLTLQPVQQRTVVIDNLAVRVLHQSPPTVGTYFPATGQCGGLTPYYFQANLDDNPVFIKPIKGYDTAGHPAVPVALPHQLTEGSPEVWQVSAITEHCTCQWIIEVHWTSGNDSGTIRVDNNSRPFMTSSTMGSVVVFSNYGHPPRWIIHSTTAPK